MARAITDLTNIEAPSGNFTKGRVKDNDGTQNGTPNNEKLHGDWTQFFQRLMAEAGITPNGNADDQVNNQLYDALIRTPRIWEGFEQQPFAVFDSPNSYWTLTISKTFSQFIQDPRNNSSPISTINNSSGAPLGTPFVLKNDTISSFNGFFGIEDPNVSKEIVRADGSSSNVDFPAGAAVRIIEYTEAFVLEIM